MVTETGTQRPRTLERAHVQKDLLVGVYGRAALNHETKDVQLPRKNVSTARRCFAHGFGLKSIPQRPQVLGLQVSFSQ